MTFDSRIKEAFSLVKADIKALKDEMSSINKRLDEISERLGGFLNENIPKTPETPKFKGIKPQNAKIDSSKGNEGVQASERAPSEQATSERASTKQAHYQGLEFKKQLESLFNTLTSQELFVFLTIYQLEDDRKKSVTHKEISQKINISEGLIRAYTSSLINKGAPIVKKKHNNRIIALTIDPGFRELGLKQQLFNMYYRQDPTQTSLFD